MLHTEEIRYGEYKAKVEIKDSIGTPKKQRITCHGDVIKQILMAANANSFEKGNRVVIEIIPRTEKFTPGLFSEDK